MNPLADVTAALGARGISVRPLQLNPPGGGDVTLLLEWRGRTREYVAEIVGRTTPATVPLVARRLPPNALLVARHVPPQVALVCRELPLHFADAAGNVFLDWDELLLDVEGRRPIGGPAARSDRRLRAFQPSGLRIVFALLCRPDLVSAPYRDIAEAAGVSLGSVHLVVQELAENGWLEERAPGRALHRTAELFDRWVDGYVLNLERRLVLGHFNAADSRAWLTGAVDVTAFGGQWGGETAAMRGTTLRAGHAIVYLPVVQDEMLRRHRLRRTVEGGTIVFRERFWGFDDAGDVVPAPLVYADLVASGDPRQVEAARELREGDDELRRLDAR